MILVFGKTGQVAKELNNFKDVLCLDRTQADLTDLKSCYKIIGQYRPSAVINAAAYTAVDRAEEEEDLANVINGEAPGIMAKACADLDIPLVHISTDYVFDGSGKTEWQESDPTNPKNTYGRSKLKGEEAIRVSGCNYVVLRTSWVISAFANNFVRTMLTLSETRDILKVVDDQIGCPTCAHDIAKASLEVARQLIDEPDKSGTYHFSGEPDISWCQFANVIFKQSGKKTIAAPILTSEYPTRAARPLNSRMNCKLIESTFKITRPNWLTGLKEILRDMEINHETA